MAALTPHDAARLNAEIRNELDNLAHVCGEVAAMRTAVEQAATYALALLLMNFYTGVERTLNRIATALGGVPAASPRWHAELLDDAALDLEGVRPAVLSRSTVDRLLLLLRFRHAIRNLYAWRLRREEMQPHVDQLEGTFAALRLDLDRFGDFLRALSKG